MEVSQLLFFRMLLLAFLSGAALGVLYDILRLFRVFMNSVFAVGTPPRKLNRLRKKLPFLSASGSPSKRSGIPSNSSGVGRKLRGALPFAVTVVLDVLFGLTCGITAILLLYDFNDGIFRFSVPFCISAGFFLYHFTVGRLISALTDVILEIVGILVSYCGLVLTLPFRGGFLVVRYIYRRWFAPRISAAREKRMKRRSDRLLVRELVRAQTGFFREDLIPAKSAVLSDHKGSEKEPQENYDK